MINGKSATFLPVGTDYPIVHKIKWATQIYKCWGQKILLDTEITRFLEAYRQQIQQTWSLMEQIGVVAECTDCAIHDGGSCCGIGIEDRFDTVLLLINLLLGAKLPDRRWDSKGCWFLGEKGCTIVARHVICINYLCKRLYQKIDHAGLQRLQRQIIREADASFVLEERLKAWLRDRQGHGER